jgi:hypothetical protein
VPFSVILFTDAFVYKYTEYIKKGGKLEYDSIKPFVLNYLHYWIQERGSGHYKFINEIMYILFSEDLHTLKEDDKKTIIETEFTIPYIINYLTEILIHFTNFRENGTLNLRIYLDNVFIKILDIWGFISVYFPFLELLFSNYDKLSESQMKIFKSIKELFIEYLYSPRIKQIDTNELYKHLDNLDNLIKVVIDEDTKPTNPLAQGLTKNKKNVKTSRIFKRLPKSKTRRFKKNKLVMLISKIKTNKKTNKK